MSKKYAYVTLLGSDNYLKGTLALYNSLKLNKCKYPLTVLITSGVSNKIKEILISKNINILLIDNVTISKKIKLKNSQMGYANWSKTFDKLRVFGLIQFDKIVFLDSDMMVMGNLDHLFSKDSLSATIAGKSYPGNKEWSTLNSGLMVITPTINEDKRLIKYINDIADLSAAGDQNVIQKGYLDWPNPHELELDEKYNVLAPYEPYYLSNKIIKAPVVLHFVGKIKPWNMSKREIYIYKLKLLLRQLKNAHTFRGVKKSLDDFDNYLNLCNKG